mgnify:CR=1 FL=1
MTRAAVLLLFLVAAVGGSLDLPVAPPRSPFDPAPRGAPERTDGPLEEPVGDDPRDTPPPVFYGEEIAGGEGDRIVYVLDRSGSMQSYKTERAYVDADGQPARGNRWERAKAEAIRSIRGLAESFRFGVLTYDCGVVGWRVELAEATEANKADAEAWIRRQYWATGMTGTGPATVAGLALLEQAGALVLLTDGAANCGAPGLAGHRAMIANGNTPGAPVHVFGIEASGDFRAFCLGVAADSGGRYVDVP